MMMTHGGPTTVLENTSAKEELLTILPLKGHIFNAFMGFVSEMKLPLFKLPAVMGYTNGFIALCKESTFFLGMLNYHCLIHQKALCGKILNIKEVVDIAMRIVCSVWLGVHRKGISVFTWRRMMLSTDLLLHMDVR